MNGEQYENKSYLSRYNKILYSLVMDRRIISLDFLRGIAACIVMCGHYYIWFTTPATPSILLMKFITYSVSAFYVLSGITLYSVYRRSFAFDFKSFKYFAIKRVFRILPLLWIATTLTLILTDVRPSLKVLFFNYTGLFGFIDERAGIARAAWSIGNEMVFYVFFPLFILLTKLKNNIFFYAAFLLSILPAIYITFFTISASKTPTTEFQYYIHPLNQLFLFTAGIWIAFYFSKVKSNSVFVRVVAVLFLSFFVLYPIPAVIHLFAGFDRFILSIFCIIICACVYKVKNDNLLPIFERPLSFLGETSYSIYLLHPIIYLVATKYFGVSNMPVVIQMGSCIIMTLVASYLVYRYIEKPAMSIGKSFTVAPLNPPLHGK